MFFTFWTPPSYTGNSETAAAPPDMAAEWKAVIPTFAVFDDDRVCDILVIRDSLYADLFRRISIPACKADLARLVLLHEYGGVYVDAHAGVGNLATFLIAVEYLARYELVIFDRRDSVKSPGDTHVINSLIAARRGSAVLDTVLQRALRNLVEHEEKEHAAVGHVAYNIFVLTGPWNLSSTVINHGLPQHEIRPGFIDKVFKYDIELDQDLFPVRFYKYYRNRSPNSHWSERQAVDRLFLPRSDV
jgi:hypothetical protein